MQNWQAPARTEKNRPISKGRTVEGIPNELAWCRLRNQPLARPRECRLECRFPGPPASGAQLDSAPPAPGRSGRETEPARRRVLWSQILFANGRTRQKKTELGIRHTTIPHRHRAPVGQGPQSPRLTTIPLGFWSWRALATGTARAGLCSPSVLRSERSEARSECSARGASYQSGTNVRTKSAAASAYQC